MISHGLQTDVTVKKWKPAYLSGYHYLKDWVVRKCFKALNPQAVSNGPLQFCDPQTQLQTNRVVWIVKLWLDTRDTNETLFT